MIEGLPLISIVIGTYNSKEYLDNLIDSVENQTFSNWECIFVDDGSQDRTVEYLRDFCKEKPKYKLVQKEHEGIPARTRNVGIDVSRGKYVAFLDHDDFWAPDKLSIQMKCFESFPNASICHTARIVWTQNRIPALFPRYKANLGDFQIQSPQKAILRGCKITQSSTVIPRNLLVKVGKYNKNILAVDDYHLFIKLYQHGPIVRIDLPLTYYYYHEKNLHRVNNVIINGLKTMANEMKKEHFPKRLINSVEGQAIKSEGVSKLDGNLKDSIRCLLQSLKIDFKIRTLAILCYAIAIFAFPSLKKLIPVKTSK